MTTRRDTQNGVALVALATVIALFGSLKLATEAVQRRTAADTSDRAVTAARLADAREALVRFVAVHGRLPCPADGTAAVRTGGGAERPAGGAAECGPGVETGVLPWQALAVQPRGALDGWRRRISYWPFQDTGGGNARSLTQVGGMAFRRCLEEIAADTNLTGPDGCPHNDPTAGGLDAEHINEFIAHDADTESETDGTDTLAGLHTEPFSATLSDAQIDTLLNWLRGQLMTDLGMRLVGRGGNLKMDPDGNGTGAAFALVSHGDNGLGARTRVGSQIPTPAAMSTGEADNIDGDGTAIFTFHDRPYRKGPNVAADQMFDDRTAALSVVTLARRAGRWGSLPEDFVQDVNDMACASAGSSDRSSTDDRKALCPPSGSGSGSG